MPTRNILAIISLLAFSALQGCSLSSIVRAQAAQDFSCAEDRVTTEDVGYDVRASGCGKAAIYNYAAQTPLRRASYDLSCPAEDIRMTDLGNNGIGVTGCGKKTTYSFVDYAWIQGAQAPQP